MFLPTKYSENCDFESQFQHLILRTVKLLTVNNLPVRANCVPSDVMPCLISSLLSVAPNITSHQAVRPQTKDLTLYEEYKLRRNEPQQRNHDKFRALEKTLPQPLLSEMASQTLVYQ